MAGSYADRHARGHGSRHADAIAQEALELEFLAQMEMPHTSPSKHRRHQPSYSASGGYGLPGSPTRHSRSEDSSQGSPTRSLGHLSPEGHQQRRLQRQLARRVHGVLPPEQRYMPPSSRKGTDDAARRALIAHLKEGRQTVSMPVSPMRREMSAVQDAAPPPYAPQLLKKAVGGRQQPSFDVHATAGSQAPAAQYAGAAPQSQPGLPKLVRQNAFSDVAPRANLAPAPTAPLQNHPSLPKLVRQKAFSAGANPAPAPGAPDNAAGLTRRASGLPTIKESHVSLAALLSAPARLSPDETRPQRPAALQRLGLPVRQGGDSERGQRSEARPTAQLDAHSGVLPAHPGAAPAHVGAARALWPGSAASSPERPAGGDSSFEADYTVATGTAVAADEPTQPRAVPAAALWAQPPAPLPRSLLPQGPFAFSAPGSVRRYSSPAASPPQWRPQRDAVPRAADAGRPGTRVPAGAPAAAPQPAAMTAGAPDGDDGSDWEDAGRWLEPAAPGATAALRTALAALAAGTPSKGSSRGRRRNASAPGSRHTSAPGSPTAGSRRPSFTQPLPWTPAGAPGTDRKRWFEQITETDGAPLSLARKTPLPRRPLDVEPSRQPVAASIAEAAQPEEIPQPMPSNLAGLLEAASDDAAEPAEGVDGPAAAPLPEECPPPAAPVEDDVQHLAAAPADVAEDAAEEPEAAVPQQQDVEVAEAAVTSTVGPQEFALPDELPESSSGTDSAEHSSGSSIPAEPAAEPAETATSAEVAVPQNRLAAPPSLPTAVGSSGAAGLAPDTSGHRRRRWRRIAPRLPPSSPSPPGTAPASPLQRSPRQLGPAPLIGTTRAPGSPEPHAASATKRPRISSPPHVPAGLEAAVAASAPGTPEQPQPRCVVSVPAFVLPKEAGDSPLPAEAVETAGSQQSAPSTAPATSVQLPEQEALPATAAGADTAEISRPRKPAVAPVAEEPAAISNSEAAAEATDDAASSDYYSQASGSSDGEPHFAPETAPAEANTEIVKAPDHDFVSNFHEDMHEEEDLTPSSCEDLASSSTVDSAAGAEAAAYQAAAAATAARVAAAASPPWRPSDDGWPERAQPDAVQPPGSSAAQDTRSPGSSSLSSVFEEEAEGQFQPGGFTPFAQFSPFTPALAAAAAAAEASCQKREPAAGVARLRFDHPRPQGELTSEIVPAGGPAEEEPVAAGAADTAVAARGATSVTTCSMHDIGAALLGVQPGMAAASTAEAAAALARGVAMHKAWIHAAKQPASGSNRTICWKVASGQVLIGYQRGLMRRNVSTVMYRVYLLDGNALAVDTAQGVLILRPPDAALHAMVVLGINAALALASGQARKSDLVADLPWSADIALDDSVVE